MNILKIIGIAAGAIAAAGIAGFALSNPGNAVETSVDAKDENLRSRLYKTDLPAFISAVEKTIPTLSTYGRSWRFISAENDGNFAVIKAEVPVVVFTDDLEIKANYDGEKGETLVNILSASRVGNSDFGENRRHIAQLLAALDEKFGRND